MKFFYSAATMGFGKGYWWHRFFNFPDFPRITKTITLQKNRGFPFAIVHLGNSIWNHIGLHNPGFAYWLYHYYSPDLIVSISGTDNQIQYMCDHLEKVSLAGIELNFSCPNVNSNHNKKIPKSGHILQLKLNYSQDPYSYDLNNIKRITLNSVPRFGGGLSGKLAQEKNWEFISKFNSEGLPVAGCSITKASDIKKLEDLGCKEIAIGSVMLTNPYLVQSLQGKIIL